MIILDTSLSTSSFQIPTILSSRSAEMLLFDIETTGLSPLATTLYMIGCIYQSGEDYHLKQWLCESDDEEKQLLQEFINFVSSYSLLIHYNGNAFDIPYLQKKCSFHDIAFWNETTEGIDLYRRIQPFKDLLNLSDCKLLSVEQLLGFKRNSKDTGYDMIQLYDEFVLNKEEAHRSRLLAHNADDLCGLLHSLPLLSLAELLQTSLQISHVRPNTYSDIQGADRKELELRAMLPYSMPLAISASSDECHLRISDNAVCILVPVFDGDLRYFYDNYKDYYYLPSEDVALHKSISNFVHKDARVQATAKTCYARVQSQFLPQWKPIFEPVYHRHYRDTQSFFELHSERKKDKEGFERYATHIMQKILLANM